ncbi:lachrymatory-factor synthase-like [Aristolochia californica]|uniref:lachrymatory-factor synthase-like n=1 Tax=Aristolochia californica TaxID=171875 RepID=UPI0035DF0244
MYVQVCTRPDIAFAVGILGRYQSNPGLDHWRTAKKVMRKKRRRCSEDFITSHKWIFNVNTCYLVEGERSKPGCVGYCSGSGVSLANGSTVAWVKEKLTAIDPVQRTLSYEIVDNNIGFGEYAATLKVFPDVNEGCTVEWSYVCDPVGAFSDEQLKSYIDLCVHTMGERMEAELQATE